MLFRSDGGVGVEPQEGAREFDGTGPGRQRHLAEGNSRAFGGPGLLAQIDRERGRPTAVNARKARARPAGRHARVDRGPGGEENLLRDRATFEPARQEPPPPPREPRAVDNEPARAGRARESVSPPAPER